MIIGGVFITHRDAFGIYPARQETSRYRIQVYRLEPTTLFYNSSIRLNYKICLVRQPPAAHAQRQRAQVLAGTGRYSLHG
jgi:hypothetical protein